MSTYIAIAATTLDGKIALGSKHNSSWTSKEDKNFLHAILDTCDVIIVGNNTYKAAKKPLSKRNCIVFTSSVANQKKVSDNLLYYNPKKTSINKLIKTLGYQKIGILGGAQTYAYLLQKNLLDEIYLTIEPLTFGKGISLFENQKAIIKKFRLVSIKQLNKQGSILLHYKKSS